MMKPITAIAIDDEPIALLVIKQFCERKGTMVLETFSEPEVGLRQIVREKPDIVFLDIEMDNVSGLEVARMLPPECTLIFTTAHAKYALDGFELDAVDFLHKPIAYERFERAVEKAMLHVGVHADTTHHSPLPEAIVVKQDYSNINIPIDDIFYVEALENYSKIFRLSGSNVIARLNIKTIHEMLPADRFVRVHRSYLIPLDRVQQFSRQEIRLEGLSRPIPVGRRYARELLDRLAGADGRGGGKFSGK